MSQTHRDRLISSLPADMQARVLKSLQEYSSDGNDAVEACFAAVIETNQRDVAQLREDVRSFLDQLAQSEAREKQLVAAVHTENLKGVRQEIRALSDKPLWRRMIASRLVGATIWCVVVYGLTNFYVEHKVRTVDPEFHKRMETVESKITKRIDDQAQLTNLRNEQLMDLIRENNEIFKKTHVVTASQTLIGKSLSFYVTNLDEQNITVGVNGRQITVPHQLTPQEYLQLDIAIKIAREIK